MPYTTGSKRGLETRVSLKQALAQLGFKGGTRGMTEWNQWVQAEKEQLAAVMERHGIEWEQKGTHEQHLSVMDYKKQERQKELKELDESITERQQEIRVLKEEHRLVENVLTDCDLTSDMIDTDPDYQLPEPSGLMTARAYKTKVVDGLVDRLKNVISAVMHADELNTALTEQLGRPVYHYHMHVVALPVVEKEIRWSKRCKDPALVGTVKDVVHQVSHTRRSII